ncbi:MAG: hypothetical protein A2144_02995 [Chloroflexi bacterium RBG_16_50_9]|nr:MAG: hypothetical protein A2144_02995 [Chloroflexi bacterium RBG_16_50_9]
MNTNEYDIAKVAIELLEGDSPLVLASIISLLGSSPRHHGTKMIVGSDGKGYGTIGGGLLEATTINEARQVLLERRPRLMDFDLTGDGVDTKRMLCGGKAVVLLDYIPSARENAEFFRYWHDAVSNGQDFYFLTLIEDDHNGLNISGRLLLFPNDKVPGNSPLSVTQLETVKAELSHIASTTVIYLENKRVVVDPIRRLKTLYCIGAGHVAVPTAKIAAMVDVRVVVIDDRPEFATTERFPDADYVYVIEEFSRAFEGLEIDADSYIVIIARSHRFDREVLEQALRTGAGYIGMISSRRKKEIIYKTLLEKGFKKEELERVHAPIGIDIGGETPEEIAVSIVAQLIKARASQPT